ncbi:MAG: methyltransferase, partial [Acidimicrobiales bacterium]|nr:methyltransferase [Acidimicrobiales bacterium]
LDAHRKRQQAQHPKLTLTDTYNVLKKLRAGTPFNAKDQLTHEQGLVSVLRSLHDQLDSAVAEAYGLAPNVSDAIILSHLCALNGQRAAEERGGLIRWLRPSFQNSATTATQTAFVTGEEAIPVAGATTAAKLPWPKTLAEQAQAVRAALTNFGTSSNAATLAKTFKGANVERVGELLSTLASLGQALELPDEKYVAA